MHVVSRKHFLAFASELLENLEEMKFIIIVSRLHVVDNIFVQLCIMVSIVNRYPSRRGY